MTPKLRKSLGDPAETGPKRGGDLTQTSRLIPDQIGSWIFENHIGFVPELGSSDPTIESVSMGEPRSNPVGPSLFP
jgi:hypothetical protein